MAKVPGPKQRAGVLRRVAKRINTAADELAGTRGVLKKMFGPLTAAERRELTAAAKRLGRDLESLIRLLTKPRKRARPKTPTKRKA